MLAKLIVTLVFFSIFAEASPGENGIGFGAQGTQEHLSGQFSQKNAVVAATHQRYLFLGHQKQSFFIDDSSPLFRQYYGQDPNWENFYKEAAVRRAELATQTIQSLGGPFRNAFVFTNRDLTNSSNFMLTWQIPRREGLRFLFSKDGNKKLSGLSFALQTERWPMYRVGARRNRTIGGEIRFDPGKLFKRRR